MDSLWKIAVTLLLAYVLAVTLMRASSLARGAIARAYHAVAGRGIHKPRLTCEVDTTAGGPEPGLRMLVGRALGCTLSTGEIRGQAASMLKDKGRLAERVAEMESPDAPVVVWTFDYPGGPSLVTRGVYLDKAVRAWAATQDGERLAAGGYDTLCRYDGQGRWCLAYLVPRDPSRRGLKGSDTRRRA